MTRDEAATRIATAITNNIRPNRNIVTDTPETFAYHLATALDALGLLPQPVAQQNFASHHRTDPDTVSAPHPTTATGQSAKPTANASWQRQPEYPSDHPAPGDLGSVPL